MCLGAHVSRDRKVRAVENAALVAEKGIGSLELLELSKVVEKNFKGNIEIIRRLLVRCKKTLSEVGAAIFGDLATCVFDTLDGVKNSSF
jgi:hypothetical protein